MIVERRNDVVSVFIEQRRKLLESVGVRIGEASEILPPVELTGVDPDLLKQFAPVHTASFCWGDSHVI